MTNPSVTSLWLPSVIFTKFRISTIPHPFGSDLKIIHELSILPRKRIQSSFLYSLTHSSGCPGALPLKQADNMLIQLFFPSHIPLVRIRVTILQIIKQDQKRLQALILNINVVFDRGEIT